MTDDQSTQTEPESQTDKTPLEQKIEALETQLISAQDEVQKAQEGQIRALADLQNFQRREAENKQFWSQAAVGKFLEKFLPSFLELSLASAHTEDQDVKTVIEKFTAKMDDLGVIKIDPQAGEIMNPDEHQVLMAAEGEPGTIVQTLEIGWKYQDKVLVPAKVSAATV
jgi:molecular chaperone GrpE